VPYAGERAERSRRGAERIRSLTTLAAAAAGIVLGRHQTVYVDGSTQNIGRGLYLHPLTKGTVALSPLRTIVVPGFEVEGLGFRI